MEGINFPTEVVEIPSKGRVYPSSHTLSKGEVNMKLGTTKEEDILTNENYINKGIVLDKLLESMIVEDIDIKSIHPGDKVALLVAARILLYGSKYKFKKGEKVLEADLSKIENKPFNVETDENGYAKYTLSRSENEILFKYLTEGDVEKVENEIKLNKKLNAAKPREVSTLLKHTIVEINGDKDKNNIKSFVDNGLLSMESRELREFIKDTEPNVDLVQEIDGEEVNIPIGLGFFWPDLLKI